MYYLNLFLNSYNYRLCRFLFNSTTEYNGSRISFGDYSIEGTWTISKDYTTESYKVGVLAFRDYNSTSKYFDQMIFDMDSNFKTNSHINLTNIEDFIPLYPVPIGLNAQSKVYISK